MTDLDLFTSGNPLTDVRVQLINCSAAGHLHVVFFPPAKTGDQEEEKLCKSHKDLVSAILSALCADHQLFMIKVLASL